MEAARLLIVLVFLLVAAGWDLKTARLPNALTYGGVALGLLLVPLLPGHGLGAALAGAALGFVPAYLLFACGGLGGGDVKLLGAVGMLVGYPLILDVLFYSLVVGTGMSLAMVIWLGRAGQLLTGLKSYVLRLVYPALVPVMPVNDVRVPFAVAVAGGYLWTLLWPGLSIVAAIH